MLFKNILLGLSHTSDTNLFVAAHRKEIIESLGAAVLLISVLHEHHMLPFLHLKFPSAVSKAKSVGYIMRLGKLPGVQIHTH